MKFLHAADLHIDSPLLGLSRYEGAPIEHLRGATRHATKNLIQLCLEENVDLLLLAGDLYDGDWKDYATGLFLIAQLKRLLDVGTKVVVLRGNHDAASRITRSLTWPANVTELSTSGPESKIFEDLGVAVHGQGFAKQRETADLAARYPAPLPGFFNIGLLHTALAGHEGGHDVYAPTTVEILRTRGYDYWALGHVHARAVVSESPWIIYPGNLQGRHVRETGPKGATLVEVNEGRVVGTPTHRVLDVVRWCRIERVLLDVGHEDDALEELLHAIDQAATDARDDGSERLLAVRVELRGTGPGIDALRADPERSTQELRAQLTDPNVWVESLRVRHEVPPDSSPADPRVLDELDRELNALTTDPDVVARLLARLEPLNKFLPGKHFAPNEPPYLKSNADIANAFEDAAWLLRGLLARDTESES